MIGEQLGNYRIVEQIGVGGMAVVYRAEHLHITGRQAAVKVLSAHLAQHATHRERFLQEASVMSSLRHHNIVDVYDLFVEKDQVAIVMEYLEGQPLDKLLAERGKLSPVEAVTLLLPVFDAVDFAHQQGVVHRDLKPSNIFIATSPTGALMPVVLDFGLARVLGDHRLTKPGTTMGTEYYMSPEQCQNRRHIGPAADIYALGVTLFEMVTGSVPFSGDSSFSVMEGHIKLRPPRPSSIRPELPAGLDDVLLKALEKNPRDRHHSATTLGQALGQAVSMVPPQQTFEAPVSVAPSLGRAGGGSPGPGLTEMSTVLLQPTNQGLAANPKPGADPKSVEWRFLTDGNAGPSRQASGSLAARRRLDSDRRVARMVVVSTVVLGLMAFAGMLGYASTKHTPTLPYLSGGEEQRILRWTLFVSGCLALHGALVGFAILRSARAGALGALCAGLTGVIVGLPTAVMPTGTLRFALLGVVAAAILGSAVGVIVATVWRRDVS